MFKVNNEDTRTTALTSFWFFYCYFGTYFTSLSSVSIVDFEQEMFAGYMKGRTPVKVAHISQIYQILIQLGEREIHSKRVSIYLCFEIIIISKRDYFFLMQKN